MKRFMSKRASFSLLFSVLALAMVLGSNVARADSWTGQDFYVGGSFNNGIQMVFNGADVSEGGGSIVTSSLNGIELAWVYCVDIPDLVYVPGNYTDTTVTDNGMVTDTNPPLGTTGGVVNNAGEVAYLVDTYANGADTDAQIALQAAIWTVIYNGAAGTTGATGLNTAYYAGSQILTDYNTDMAGLGSAALSSIYWFSPSTDGSTFDQALIGNNNGAVPEPASILLLGTLLLGVLHLLKRKLAPSQQ